MKKVIIKYPKKKPKLKLEDLGEVAEPQRLSMYQVMMEHLKTANRETFLHRIIYVGEHQFPCDDQARSCFENIIKESNETYCMEKLTGFFLFYPQYFCHMVEGDEDNLNKHLGMLLNKEASHACYLGVTKLLIHVSNINQRFLENWVYFTGHPPKLMEKLDSGMDLHNSGRYIYNCIKKMYTLVGNYAEDMLVASESPGPKLSFDVVSVDSCGAYAQDSCTSQSAHSGYNSGAYRLFLPEYELLEFVIRSSFTMKLEEYYGLYGVVPMRDIYKDRVWPVPHDFIPYDVFERQYDCITELPKESRKTRAVDLIESNIRRVSRVDEIGETTK